jgi:hypothetical protein
MVRPARSAPRCAAESTPRREPADDRDAPRREIGGQPIRGFERHRRCRTRSDDGDRGSVETVECATKPDRGRTVADGEERRGHARIVPGKHADARRRGALARQSRPFEERRRKVEQNRIAGEQPGGQPGAGKVLEQGQRNRVIERHGHSGPPCGGESGGARRGIGPVARVGADSNGRGPRGRASATWYTRPMC